MDSIIRKYDDIIKLDNNIYKSHYDQLKYKSIKIQSNGIRIFFIEDKESNMCGANMYVEIGHIHNPENIEGMAHYLEHMLFMGSKKYPGSNYFQEKISTNNGFTNAFTSEECTQYFFNCSQDSFMEILDIFSNFFIEPFFDVKYVEKEVSAVESEHQKNIGDDGWRIMNLSKQFITDKINSKFGTGTKETLLGSCENNPELLREELIKFYNKYYSSDKMILFIAHNDINDGFIDKITSMFSLIPLRDKYEFNNDITFKKTSDTYEMINVKITDTNHRLIIRWLVSGSIKYKNNICTNSFNVINYILGHEGPNSLYNILIGEQYITELYSGIEKSYNTISSLIMYITLTDKGYNNWKKILYIIHCYIDNIYNTISDDKLKDYFDEIHKLNINNLKTIDKTDGLSVAQQLANIYDELKCDIEYLPINSILYDKYDKRKNHFFEVLEELKLNNAKIILGSHLIENTDKIDKYYGTNYLHIEEKIDIDHVNLCKKIKMKLPILNKYISDSLYKYYPINNTNDSYCKLKSKSKYNTFYVKKSNSYDTFTTTCIIDIELKSFVNKNVNNYIMLCLYINYIRNLNNSAMYLMLTANINVYVTTTTYGINIIINGTHKNFDSIFKTVINWFYDKSTDIDIDTYTLMYNKFYTKYKMYDFIDSYKRIGSEFNDMINNKHTISNSDILQNIDKYSPDVLKDSKSPINFSNFKDTIINLMSKGSIKGIFGGSIKLNHVQNIIYHIESLISYSNTDSTYIIKNTDIMNKTVYNLNPNNKELAIGCGIYLGHFPENNCSYWEVLKPICILLNTYVSEKFSNLMRTEKQLGYIANTTLINLNKDNNTQLYLLFIIQSNVKNCKELIFDYINNILPNDINSITEEQFESLKNGLYTDLTEVSLNIIDEVFQNFKAIKLNTLDYLDNETFNRKQRMAECVIKLTRKIFINFFKSLDKKIHCIEILPI